MLCGTAYFLRDEGMTILRADENFYSLIGYQPEEFEDFYESQMIQAVQLSDYEAIGLFIFSGRKEADVTFHIVQKYGILKRIRVHATQKGEQDGCDIMRGEFYEADE